MIIIPKYKRVRLSGIEITNIKRNDKVLSILLIAVMLLSLAACGEKKPEPNGDNTTAGSQQTEKPGQREQTQKDNKNNEKTDDLTTVEGFMKAFGITEDGKIMTYGAGELTVDYVMAKSMKIAGGSYQYKGKNVAMSITVLKGQPDNADPNEAMPACTLSLEFQKRFHRLEHYRICKSGRFFINLSLYLIVDKLVFDDFRRCFQLLIYSLYLGCHR